MSLTKRWSVQLAILAVILNQTHSGAITKVETEVAIVKNKTVIHRGIHKRGLFYPVLLYPYNACSGILVAIAVPLNLKGRNVFLSYNFEANYNMPNQPKDSFPGPITRFPGLVPEVTKVDPSADASPDDVVLRRSFEKEEEITEFPEAEETTEAETDSIQKRDIEDRMVLSRKGVYRVLESRLNANGVDGKKCLLLAICESAKFPLLESNGVLGHILHVILTPSSSMDENLPSEYTKAENLGQQSDCRRYEKYCGFSVLNTFTKLF